MSDPSVNKVPIPDGYQRCRECRHVKCVKAFGRGCGVCRRCKQDHRNEVARNKTKMASDDYWENVAISEEGDIFRYKVKWPPPGGHARVHYHENFGKLSDEGEWLTFAAVVKKDPRVRVSGRALCDRVKRGVIGPFAPKTHRGGIQRRYAGAEPTPSEIRQIKLGTKFLTMKLPRGGALHVDNVEWERRV